MIFGAVTAFLGGLIFFLLGMRYLSDGLRVLAGGPMRTLLTWATGRPAAGLTLGTSLGFIAHSGPATVMTIGFVNAGLLSLGRALPMLFGANVGTSLAMQVISLPLERFAYGAIAIGGGLFLWMDRELWRQAGRALLGFGILFLGLKMMGAVAGAHRDLVSPLLARIDGSSLSGMLGGIAISAILTALVQSSGAIIGMAFVFAGSGVVTHLSQVYPIVLGAHIGTCVVGLMASVGTGREAKRAAYSNLGFNLFNVALAVLLAPVFMAAVRWSSGDLVREIANLHTLVMVVAALILLPLTGLIERAFRRVWPTGDHEPSGSYLDPALLATPEGALQATIAELQRAAAICLDSFRLLGSAVETRERSVVRRILKSEAAVNEIKRAVQAYLSSLTRGYLSRRQALFVQALNRCAVEVERIGDHISALGKWLPGRRKEPGSGWGQVTLEAISVLFDQVEIMLTATVDGLDSTRFKFGESADRVVACRDTYRRVVGPAKASVNGLVERHEMSPAEGLSFSEIAAACDRIVRHCGVIAFEEREPFFAIKASKLPDQGVGG